MCRSYQLGEISRIVLKIEANVILCSSKRHVLNCFYLIKLKQALCYVIFVWCALIQVFGYHYFSCCITFKYHCYDYN